MKWCNRSLVFSPCYYGLCLSIDDFHKTLKKIGVPPEEYPPFLISPSASATTSFIWNDNKCFAIVTLKPMSYRSRGKPEIHALLAHEAVHVWRKVCEILGEGEPSAEFEAYSIQNILLNLIRELS